MSNLSQRASCRSISRPNAAKALARIKKELEALIDCGPVMWGDGQPLMEDLSRRHVVAALNYVRELYDLPQEPEHD
jgi:hypothetical protein